MREEEIKRAVREGYARIVQEKRPCCAPAHSCCGGADSAEEMSKKIGYAAEELQAVPEGANLGLGCGNPTALASLKQGEIVLDLGSGAGFDCFLAANQVGEPGRVIGVDMTPEMIERARENARKGGYKNVEFRLGEIENLPVADGSVDVVISNCVINLSLDKRRVFDEAFRVLKPGGRLMVSDVVLLKELPDSVRNSIEAYLGCLAGAIMREDYIGRIKAAGFQGVKTIEETPYPIGDISQDPMVQEIRRSLKLSPEAIRDLGNSVVSIKVQGMKPDGMT